MNFGFAPACLRHETGRRHPENADRLRAVRQGLARRHAVDFVEPEPAQIPAIEAVHDPNYVANLRSFCEDGGGQWDPDTVAVEATWEAALASAGLALWSAETAATGDDDRETPFALGRPPGHHAVADDAMGFCFFNNAVIGADHLLRESTVTRVAIIDWDVHHGNGTQELTEERDDICYCSIHEDGLYPGTGAVTETGRAAGAGTTLNLPLPAGAGDVDYAAAFDRVVIPAIRTYDPDVIIVSAGFDAHRHDPISRTRVTTEGFGLMTAKLTALTRAIDSGIGFVLEGGYSLDALSEGVAKVHDVFDGSEPGDVDGELEPGVEELLTELTNEHPLHR